MNRKKIAIRAAWTVLGLIIGLPLLGVVFQLVAGAVDQVRYPAPGTLISVDGGRLHLHCTGPEQSAHTYVIEVGAGNWSIHWAELQEAFASSARVCTYDRLGFGWSDALPYGPRDAKLQVRQLHQALSAANESGPYILIGHSYGGYLVRLYRAQYPREVEAIVLVESAHERQWEEMPGLVPMVLDYGSKSMSDAQLMARFGVLRLMGVTSQDRLPDERNNRAANAAAKTSKFYTAFRSEIDGVLKTAQLVQESGDLDDLPLLVITAGESVKFFCNDAFGVPCEENGQRWSALQSELASLSTRSEHVILPQATHAIQLEAADEVVAITNDFVGRLPASG